MRYQHESGRVKNVRSIGCSDAKVCSSHMGAIMRSEDTAIVITVEHPKVCCG